LLHANYNISLTKTAIDIDAPNTIFSQIEYEIFPVGLFVINAMGQISVGATALGCGVFKIRVAAKDSALPRLFGTIDINIIVQDAKPVTLNNFHNIRVKVNPQSSGSFFDFSLLADPGSFNFSLAPDSPFKDVSITNSEKSLNYALQFSSTADVTSLVSVYILAIQLSQVSPITQKITIALQPIDDLNPEGSENNDLFIHIFDCSLESSESAMPVAYGTSALSDPTIAIFFEENCLASISFPLNDELPHPTHCSTSFISGTIGQWPPQYLFQRPANTNIFRAQLYDESGLPSISYASFTSEPCTYRIEGTCGKNGTSGVPCSEIFQLDAAFPGSTPGGVVLTTLISSAEWIFPTYTFYLTAVCNEYPKATLAITAFKGLLQEFYVPNPTSEHTGFEYGIVANAPIGTFVGDLVSYPPSVKSVFECTIASGNGANNVIIAPFRLDKIEVEFTTQKALSFSDTFTVGDGDIGYYGASTFSLNINSNFKYSNIYSQFNGLSTGNNPFSATTVYIRLLDDNSQAISFQKRSDTITITEANMAPELIYTFELLDPNIAAVDYFFVEEVAICSSADPICRSNRYPDALIDDFRRPFAIQQNKLRISSSLDFSFLINNQDNYTYSFSISARRGSFITTIENSFQLTVIIKKVDIKTPVFTIEDDAIFFVSEELISGNVFQTNSLEDGNNGQATFNTGNKLQFTANNTDGNATVKYSTVFNVNKGKIDTCFDIDPDTGVLLYLNNTCGTQLHSRSAISLMVTAFEPLGSQLIVPGLKSRLFFTLKINLKTLEFTQTAYNTTVGEGSTNKPLISGNFPIQGKSYNGAVAVYSYEIIAFSALNFSSQIWEDNSTNQLCSGSNNFVCAFKYASITSNQVNILQFTSNYLNHDLYSQYSFVIKVYDTFVNPPLYATTTVVINILTENVFAPVFLTNLFASSASIPEFETQLLSLKRDTWLPYSNKDDFVLTVYSQDNDRSRQSRSITFSIIDGNLLGSNAEAFSITTKVFNSTTSPPTEIFMGTITVKSAIFYENRYKGEFILTIQAQDNPDDLSTNRSDITTVTITLKESDHTPYFSQPSYSYTADEQIGQLVNRVDELTLSTMDNTGVLDPVVCDVLFPCLSAFNQNNDTDFIWAIVRGDANSHFSIDSPTGKIHVINDALNSDSYSVYNLTISVEAPLQAELNPALPPQILNNSVLKKEVDVTITVNPSNYFAPYFFPLLNTYTTLTVNENLEAQFIHTVAAKTYNKSPKAKIITYALAKIECKFYCSTCIMTEYESANCPQPKFKIDSVTGNVTVPANTEFDWELANMFKLTVQATHSMVNPERSVFGTLIVAVNINSHKPQFVPVSTICFREQIGTNVNIAEISAATYENVIENKHQSGHLNQIMLFTIDQVIHVSNNNADVTNSNYFKVTSKQGSTTASSIGTIFTNVTSAYNADSPQFKITLRATDQSYYLNLTTDYNPANYTTTYDVYLQIYPENNWVPEFNVNNVYTFDAYENNLTKRAVLTLGASDKDTSTNSTKITYSIDSIAVFPLAGSSDLFEITIHADTGVISLGGLVNATSMDYITVIVRIADSGNLSTSTCDGWIPLLSKTTTTAVTFYVLPVFQDPIFAAEPNPSTLFNGQIYVNEFVPENISPGSLVRYVDAQEPRFTIEKYNNVADLMTFTITSCNPRPLFIIETEVTNGGVARGKLSVTGDASLIQTPPGHLFDASKDNIVIASREFKVTIKATFTTYARMFDKVNNAHFSTTTLTIGIQPVFTAPIFLDVAQYDKTGDVPKISISENAAVGSVVTNVYAYENRYGNSLDPTKSPIQSAQVQLIYAIDSIISSPALHSPFVIDKDTGNILVATITAVRDDYIFDATVYNFETPGRYYNLTISATFDSFSPYPKVCPSDCRTMLTALIGIKPEFTLPQFVRTTYTVEVVEVPDETSIGSFLNMPNDYYSYEPRYGNKKVDNPSMKRQVLLNYAVATVGTPFTADCTGSAHEAVICLTAPLDAAQYNVPSINNGDINEPKQDYRQYNLRLETQVYSDADFSPYVSNDALTGLMGTGLIGHTEVIVRVRPSFRQPIFSLDYNTMAVKSNGIPQLKISEDTTSTSEPVYTVYAYEPRFGNYLHAKLQHKKQVTITYKLTGPGFSIESHSGVITRLGDTIPTRNSGPYIFDAAAHYIDKYTREYEINITATFLSFYPLDSRAMPLSYPFSVFIGVIPTFTAPVFHLFDVYRAGVKSAMSTSSAYYFEIFEGELDMTNPDVIPQLDTCNGISTGKGTSQLQPTVRQVAGIVTAYEERFLNQTNIFYQVENSSTGVSDVAPFTLCDPDTRVDGVNAGGKVCARADLNADTQKEYNFQVSARVINFSPYLCDGNTECSATPKAYVAVKIAVIPYFQAPIFNYANLLNNGSDSTRPCICISENIAQNSFVVTIHADEPRFNPLLSIRYSIVNFTYADSSAKVHPFFPFTLNESTGVITVLGEYIVRSTFVHEPQILGTGFIRDQYDNKTDQRTEEYFFDAAEYNLNNPDRSYSLVVKASYDSYTSLTNDTITATSQIKIAVQPFYSKPIFEMQTYEFAITEYTAPNTKIGAVVAHIPRYENQASLRYTIKSESTAGVFAIDVDTVGEITVKEDVDASFYNLNDVDRAYSITIMATIVTFSPCVQSDLPFETTNVTIKIRPVFAVPPVFIGLEAGLPYNYYSATQPLVISENVKAPFIVSTVQAYVKRYGNAQNPIQAEGKNAMYPCNNFSSADCFKRDQVVLIYTVVEVKYTDEIIDTRRLPFVALNTNADSGQIQLIGELNLPKERSSIYLLDASLYNVQSIYRSYEINISATFLSFTPAVTNTQISYTKMFVGVKPVFANPVFYNFAKNTTTYVATVSEFLQKATNILEAFAHEPRYLQQCEIEFSINTSGVPFEFAQPNSGNISTTGISDSSAVSFDAALYNLDTPERKYQFWIKATVVSFSPFTAANEEQPSSQALVIVNIIPIIMAPMFSPFTSPITINETTSISTTITQINAYEVRYRNQTLITYRITQIHSNDFVHHDAIPFAVNNATGDISVIATLDASKYNINNVNRNYTITVQAIVHTFSPFNPGFELWTDASLIIQVTPNFEPPIFSRVNYSGIIYENDLPGTFINTVFANVSRFNNQVVVKYAITEITCGMVDCPWAAAYFTVTNSEYQDPALSPFPVEASMQAGKVLLNTTLLNATEINQYTVKIEASFSSFNSLPSNAASAKSSVIMTVSVKCNNLYPPIMTFSTLTETMVTTVNLNESIDSPQYIAHATGFDADCTISNAGSNIVTFTMEDTMREVPLRINSQSGEITAINTCIPKNQSSYHYTLNISAHDNPVRDYETVSRCYSRCANLIFSFPDKNETKCKQSCSDQYVTQADCNDKCSMDDSCIQGCKFYDSYSRQTSAQLGVNIYAVSTIKPVFVPTVHEDLNTLGMSSLFDASQAHYYTSAFYFALPGTPILTVKANSSDQCSCQLKYIMDSENVYFQIDAVSGLISLGESLAPLGCDINCAHCSGIDKCDRCHTGYTITDPTGFGICKSLVGRRGIDLSLRQDFFQLRIRVEDTCTHDPNPAFANVTIYLKSPSLAEFLVLPNNSYGFLNVDSTTSSSSFDLQHYYASYAANTRNMPGFEGSIASFLGKQSSTKDIATTTQRPTNDWFFKVFATNIDANSNPILYEDSLHLNVLVQEIRSATFETDITLPNITVTFSFGTRMIIKECLAMVRGYCFLKYNINDELLDNNVTSVQISVKACFESCQNISSNYSSITVQRSQYKSLQSLIPSSLGVYAFLPLRDIILTEFFDFPVYGYANYTITGFHLSFNTPTNNYEFVEIQCSTAYACDVVLSSDKFTIYVTGTLLDTAPLVPTPLNYPTRLAKVIARYTNEIDPLSYSITSVAMTGKVLFLINEFEQIFFNSLQYTDMQFFDRANSNVPIASTTGFVYLVCNSIPVAVLASTVKTVFFNTAYFDDKPLTSPLIIEQLFIDGQINISTKNAVCISSTVLAVTVENCNTLTVSSTNMQYGTSTITIAIAVAGVTVESKLDIIVFFPDLNTLKFSTADTILNLIEDYTVNGAKQYQNTTLDLTVKFKLGSVLTPDFSIKDIATFDSSNFPGEVSISKHIISGKKKGSVNIFAKTFNGSTLSTFVIVVSDEPVHVQFLAGVITSSMSIATFRQNSSCILLYLCVDTVILKNEHLQVPNSLAALQVFAFFSDASNIPFTIPADPVSLKTISSNSSVVYVTGSSVFFNQSGAADVYFSWVDENLIASNNKTFAGILGQNSLSLSADLLTPSNMTLSKTECVLLKTSHTRLYELSTTPLLRCSIIMYLQYGDKLIPQANEPSVEYSMSASGIFEYSIQGEEIIIMAISEGAGSLTIKVNSLSQSITVKVIGDIGCTIQAEHFPLYTPTQYTQSYYKISENVYQKAYLSVLLNFSDGFKIDVTKYVDITQSNPAYFDGNSKVISWDNPAKITVMASLFTDISCSSDLELVDVITPVTKLTTVLNSNTLNGIIGSVTAFDVTATFFDGSYISSLFYSNGQPKYADLVEFSMDKNAIAKITDPKVALMSILNNYPSTITLNVQAKNTQVNATSDIYVNLDAAVGDIDIGNMTGLPIESQVMNTVFYVDIFANTGKFSLGSISINLNYDNSNLQFLDIKDGKDFAENGGHLIATNYDYYVSFGGILSSKYASARYHIGSLKFKALKDHIPEFFGVITRMNNFYSNGTSDPVGIGRTFRLRKIIAGDTTAIMARRRSVANGEQFPLHRLARAAQGVATIPCSPAPACQCAGVRQLGDVNFDCVFDILDVSFHQTFITERELLTSNSNIAQNASLLDVDHNGVTDLEDTVFLLRAVFQQLLLLKDMTITPATNVADQCMITINISMLLAGNNFPAINGGLSAKLKIQLTVIQADKSSLDQSAVVAPARDIPIWGNSGNSNIYEAASLGNGMFQLQLYTDLIETAFGISIIQEVLNPQNDSSFYAPMYGSPKEPYSYPTINFRFAGVQSQIHVIKTLGYNVFTTFQNEYKSSECFNVYQPEFSEKNYSFPAIKDYISVGTILGAVNATDLDLQRKDPRLPSIETNGKSSDIYYEIVSFSELGISSLASLPFTLNPTTGDVATAQTPLKIGIFVLYVQAHDDGYILKKYSDIIKVTITVESGSVSFNEDNYTANITEDRFQGSIINVSASSTALNPVNYLIASIIPSTKLLTIDSVSGEVSINCGGFLLGCFVASSFPPHVMYTVSIVATDNSSSVPIHALTTLVITILPINKFNPEFSNIPVYAVSLYEDYESGTLVFADFLTIDHDLNIASKSVLYSLKNNDLDNFPSFDASKPLFAIDNTTGRITTVAIINYEIIPGFKNKNLIIIATDQGCDPLLPDCIARSSELNLSVTFFENSHQPKFTMPSYAGHVYELANESTEIFKDIHPSNREVFGKLEVISYESLNKGPTDSTFTFNITAGNIDNVFRLENTRGNGNSSARLFLNTFQVLNSSKQNVYLITVKASDDKYSEALDRGDSLNQSNDCCSVSTIIKIVVYSENRFYPVFTNFHNTLSNAPLCPIENVTAHNYSSSVNIIDTPPDSSELPNYYVDIFENFNIAQSFFAVSGFDADTSIESKSFNFFVSDNDIHIDANSGALFFTKNLDAAARLDPWIVIIIIEDQGVPKKSSRCTLTILVKPIYENPIFEVSTQVVILPENAENIFVQTLQAFIPRFSMNENYIDKQAIVTYSFSSVTCVENFIQTPCDAADLFSVDNVTGNVTTNGKKFDASKYNRNTATREYILIIRATFESVMCLVKSTNPLIESFANIRVQIQPLFEPIEFIAGDNTCPICEMQNQTFEESTQTYSIAILENHPLNSVIGRVSAIEPRFSASSGGEREHIENQVTMLYNLVNSSDQFAVDKYTGEIILLRPLDTSLYNTAKADRSYVLIINATFDSFSPLSVNTNWNTAVFVIAVIPLFSFPIFSSPNGYHGFIYEDDAIDTFVGVQVYAEIPRFVGQIVMLYKFETLSAPFRIDEFSGAIFLKEDTVLAAIVNDSYTLNVSVTFKSFVDTMDNDCPAPSADLSSVYKGYGQNYYVSYTSVTVNVLGVNRYSPAASIFTHSLEGINTAFEVNIDEERHAQYVTQAVSADSDYAKPDSGDNVIRYSLKQIPEANHGYIPPPFQRFRINANTGEISSVSDTCIYSASESYVLQVTAYDVPVITSAMTERCKDRCVNQFTNLTYVKCPFSIYPIYDNVSIASCFKGCESFIPLNFESNYGYPIFDKLYVRDACVDNCTQDLACKMGCKFFNGYSKKKSNKFNGYYHR